LTHKPPYNENVRKKPRQRLTQRKLVSGRVFRIVLLLSVPTHQRDQPSEQAVHRVLLLQAANLLGENEKHRSKLNSPLVEVLKPHLQPHLQI